MSSIEKATLRYLMPLLYLLGGFLLLISCSTRNQVRLMDKNFDQEIEEQQNLVFQFNRDIYPDSLLNQWDSTAYIQFEPRVAGAFRWNQSNELVFSPAEGFAPGVSYEATLTSKLLSKARKKDYRLGKDRKLSFHTAPIKVVQVRGFWTRGRQVANVMVQLDIDFNYQTDITQAASKLSLSSAGSSLNFNAINGGIGKRLSVQFNPISNKDKPVVLDVGLAKGIAIAGSTISSRNDTVFQTSILSRYVLEVTGTNAQHDGTTGMVQVSLSQPVPEQGLKAALQIEPSVNFELAVNDGGFNLTSNDFDPKQTYNITLGTAIQGSYGGRLKSPKTVQASFGELEPSLHFINTKGIYLSSRGYKNLAMNIVQVPEVKVSVIKVYENNMMALFRRGQRWGYTYGDEDEDGDGSYHDYRYYDTEDLGDTVYTRTYDVEKLPRNNAAHLLHLDFADKLRDYDGVYVITVASTRQRWVQASKILSLSDIGLMVKQEKDRLLVFANSIRSATPINNATISFISTTNQLMQRLKTNKEGVAILDQESLPASGMQVGMVSAKSDGEYSFISFDRSRIETSRYDVGGRVVNATGLNAWIYAERNLYRPGETVHASAVLRDESWMPPGEMPVKLRLVMPNGKEFANRRKMLNEQGSVTADFDIPATALTGTYILQAYSGNDVLLNSYNISIEDFMPDRIKSELKLPRNQYQIGETVTTLLQADNLFGTPAANRNYEWELNIAKAAFQPKGFEDYDFSVVKNAYFKTVFRSGVTGADGSARESAVLDDSFAETGLLKGNIRATVFDETGRPVHRYAHFDLYSQPVFIGIRNFNYYVGTRMPMQLNLIALNKDGKPQQQQVVVKMIRKEWQNVIEQSGDRYRYVSKWVEKDLGAKTIRISGNNTVFGFTPDQSGEYEVQVYRQGSNSYVSKTFYAYGMGSTGYSSFEVNNEGNVTIKADKESYQPGEDINLLFTTPFEGRMLVSVERDKVLEYHFLNTSNKSASLKIKANDAFLPNIYIATTLFRAMDGSDMPLTVAHGYQPIKVEARQHQLPVAVKVSEKSRSRTKQVIEIKTAPHAFVTVAAVDEGILQVKNYDSPNPYDYFYQKVALGVRSFDIYPLLLPEYKMTSSFTGGDGGDEASLDGRVNPLFVNRVKNVSFWSGLLKADGSGRIRYEIDLPQFSGDIRVMAVAYKDKAFGSFDSHMKVADPIVLSTALPRFLSPGDSTLVPVTMSNTTTQPAQVQVSIAVQGPLGIGPVQQQQLSIAPNSEARALFQLGAAQQTGAAKLVVTAKALNETFVHETEIAVRPPASLQKSYATGMVAAGSNQALSLRSNFIPSTFKGHLVMGNTPLVQFSKNISYLVRYPYGCVEQTTSAAFPQLYYGDLARVLGNQKGEEVNANYNVQQAVLKLQSMQLPNGSLSYWPGGNYESWWGSVFAAHFLTEAARAGFDVNDQVLARLMEYLKFRLRKKEVIAYYYNGDKRKTIAAKEIPYSLYVLALARQPQQSMMNYYKGNPESLSLDGRYLLAAAYQISGQPDKARQVLPASFSGEKSESQFGGSFYSYLRDRAIALNALLDINPKDPQVAVLARQLSEEMRTNPYLNTQESVFSVLAMGRMARSAAGTQGLLQLLADGKNAGSSTGAPLRIDLKSFQGLPLQLKASGKGNFYYYLETEGVTADGKIREEDSFLKVRRNFYTRNGQLITGNTFKQNDLVVVKITIEGHYRSVIENVVITDMLPAGFEIENTRLNGMPDLKWVTEIRDKDEPDYMDIRDDRLNLFTSVDSRPKTFYYMVRAVSPGTYKLGPVQADAMYNGMYHSYHGSGTIRVNM
ncbi:hypothetical protein GCM10027051_22890 [Niabella terrae]